ncbi:MAG TPA: TonB-dependent receptor [Flavobacteriales bacterium]|jgi:iron complex outermembrane receptor protein|nr:TonB-dependent receptor [Flavobacteriales bacterium]
MLIISTLNIFNYKTLTAQEPSKIQLIDLESSLPISGATFSYGAQKGTTDEAGMMTFEYLSGEVMILSHVSYGESVLSDLEVQTMIRNGVYYPQRISFNLYPVTVIDVRGTEHSKERLALKFEDHMQLDGAAILNQSPSFNSIRKGGNYGYDPVFRGFKYDQLNVVLNGAQSSTAACPNRMDPPTSQMAPNMMHRVEILKGPHALRYGTGFGATINFIPAPLRFSDDLDVYGRVSGGYESNGEVINSEGMLGFSDKNYDLGFFGSWSQGNDYTDGNGDKVAAGYRRTSVGANLGLKLSDSQQLRLTGLYNIAKDADFPALPMDLREDNTLMINARHDITLNRDYLKSWNTTLYASFVDHLMDNLMKDLDPRMVNASTNAATTTFGGRTEGYWSFANSRLYAGVDYRSESAEGIRERTFLMGPNQGKTVQDNAWQNSTIQKMGAFGEYHWTLARGEMIGSVRLEINNANTNDPTEEFLVVNTDTEVTQFNPNISLGYVHQINTKINAGIWLGRAQRSGSLTERYINYFPVGQDPYEMLGNPDLAPEINNQLDLTLAYTTSNTIIGVDVFASYLQDYISSVIDTTLSPRMPTSPGVRKFENIENAFKTGFEVSWTQELFAGMNHRLALAYTYGQDLQRDEPLPEIAPLDLRYTLRGNYLRAKLQPEVALRYVLEQDRVSEEFGETVTPSFALVDIQIAYRLSNWLRVSAGVQNVFDEAYYEHLNRSVRGTQNPIFARGRNFSMSLSAQF